MCGNDLSKVLSPTNFLTVNKSVLRKLGSDVAIYYSVISTIITQVELKQTADVNGFFPLNRDYMEQESGLDPEGQFNVEAKLQRLGVLEYSSSDRSCIKFSGDKVLEVIAAGDPESLKLITKAMKLPKTTLEKNKSAAAKVKKQKEQVEYDAAPDPLAKYRHKIVAMQKKVKEKVTDPEIIVALCNWVESVYSRDKFNFLSFPLIDKFKSDLNVAANGNKQTALRILEVAIETGYRRIDWCVERLAKSDTRSLFGGTVSESAATSKKATGVMEGVEF